MDPSGIIFGDVLFWFTIAYVVFIGALFVWTLVKPRKKSRKPAKLIPFRAKVEND